MHQVVWQVQIIQAQFTNISLWIAKAVASYHPSDRVFSGSERTAHCACQYPQPDDTDFQPSEAGHGLAGMSLSPDG